MSQGLKDSNTAKPPVQEVERIEGYVQPRNQGVVSAGQDEQGNLNDHQRGRAGGFWISRYWLTMLITDKTPVRFLNWDAAVGKFSCKAMPRRQKATLVAK